MDLWLIEGLISSPLVFIRGRNGGKAGGFLTAGTAALGAPVPSNWVRQSGAAAFTHQVWQPWPVVYMIALLGALIHSSSQLFVIYLVKYRPGLLLAVKCVLGDLITNKSIYSSW